MLQYYRQDLQNSQVSINQIVLVLNNKKTNISLANIFHAKYETDNINT